MTKKWSLLAVALIIIGIAGMAYQHFRFGEPLKDYQERWDLSAEQLQNLSINGGFDTDVSFISSQDGSGYVEISGRFKQKVIDKLNQTKTDADGLKLDMSVTSFEFFALDFSSPQAKITVAVPDGQQPAQFQFSLGSGDSTIQGLRADHADLKMLSGNLSVTDAKADQLSLHSSSGNVSLAQIEAPVTLNMSSGNLSLNQISGEGSYSLSSGNLKGTGVTGGVKIKISSGNVTLNDFTGTGQIESFSGNVTLNSQRSDDLDITSYSGNVKLARDAAFQGFYDLQASSGSIHAPDSPQQTNDVIKVRTTSGNITIK
ncbi:DUF4097 family beta strand repeat-containing protein [Paenibacillus pinistramenti]|uniref:DUF4097 family beta strand repeat-containing protein n=1 Tax=Paenibacillus pinistramenti TaxID=1768003 RepID=UPI001107C432|nr:DUF4097 family beta strand repeat-containing protein [Paenibacillus pinistramenti]